MFAHQFPVGSINFMAGFIAQGNLHRQHSRLFSATLKLTAVQDFPSRNPLVREELCVRQFLMPQATSRVNFPLLGLETLVKLPLLIRDEEKK